ncbi:MAG: class I SAM-dependent methyltransferase, partial [Chloroflexi bacterium]|nr:class I SAM-dependent methyltransferase [Chloroflexota bacterium]
MSTTESVQITRQVLSELFGDQAPDLGVRLWDGSSWPDETSRRATLVLKHPSALRTMLIPGTDLSMGEAYLYDDIDIQGDIESVFGLADHLMKMTAERKARLRLARNLLRLPAPGVKRYGQRGPAQLNGRRHSVERDRQAVTYHYNVSNDFYGLWLDSRMVYSCAYFQSPEDDLDTAQLHKLDYICKKLRLKPGQRLLDIGCGWGGLVIHAAQHYGVEATGITLSQPQAELANARIQAAGLGDRAQVQVRDYRQVDEPGAYDALVSVGMFEHVGKALLGVYFARAWGLLKPGGVFLNHGIANRADARPGRGRSFSDTYVFPDGELVPISTTLTIAEENGFEVRDVESLREHY